MNKKIHIAIVALFFWLASVGPARDAAAQKNSLQLVNYGPVTLNLSRMMASGDLEAEDDSKTVLVWSRPMHNSKVTVSTFAPDQKFVLTVEAVKVKGGRAVGAVRLVDGMLDTDLIVGLKRKKHGRARIRYRAESAVEDGNSVDDGLDVHTVTFTLTEI